MGKVQQSDVLKTKQHIANIRYNPLQVQTKKSSIIVKNSTFNYLSQLTGNF